MFEDDDISNSVTDNLDYLRFDLLTKFHKLRLFKGEGPSCCYENSPIANLIECIDCTNCMNCILCVGISNKTGGYYLLNELVSVNVFNQALKALNTPRLPKHMEWAVEDKR